MKNKTKKGKGREREVSRGQQIYRALTKPLARMMDSSSLRDATTTIPTTTTSTATTTTTTTPPRLDDEFTQQQLARYMESVTVDELLSDPVSCDTLMGWMRNNFCHETLLCYLQIQQFKNDTKIRPVEDYGALREQINVIYATFIEPGTQLEINIDGAVRTVIQQRLISATEQPENIAPLFDIFDQTMAILKHQLRTDALPRFVKSDSFAQLVRHRLQQHSEPWQI
eukprot:TRINITY_DN2421_c0_g1_i1.p1 TRINITY_DN2421_c0_g1~~TRINITY_DN2421_c0_g1_i1.p1  ORF type:complete len:235 (-),score=50.44 TRINITY_DN2421_c0_g1_i1:21-698(-)